MGLLGMAIVVVIALILWAKNAQKVSGTAKQVHEIQQNLDPNADSRTQDPNRVLPDLHDMREATSSYQTEIEAAREAIDASGQTP